MRLLGRSRLDRLRHACGVPGARLYLSPRMWPAFTGADYLRALLS